jgi:hypothetical protein
MLKLKRERRHLPLPYVLAVLFCILLLQLANLHVQTHAAAGHARQFSKQIPLVHGNKSEPMPSSTGPYRYGHNHCCFSFDQLVGTWQ